MKLENGFFVLFSILTINLHAQKTDSTKLWERIFTPSIPMGYIGKNAQTVSGGLIVQTSIEYRTPKNWVYRVNYDVFDLTLKLDHPNNSNSSYTGKIPMSELIAGAGYRLTRGKHNGFVLAQSGLRLYGYPILTQTASSLSLVQENRHIYVARYTVGYEYQLMENVFLNVEVFGGQVFRSRDYWSNKRVFGGVTVGVSTPLF